MFYGSSLGAGAALLRSAAPVKKNEAAQLPRPKIKAKAKPAPGAKKRTEPPTPVASAKKAPKK